MRIPIPPPGHGLTLGVEPASVNPEAGPAYDAVSPLPVADGSCPETVDSSLPHTMVLDGDPEQRPIERPESDRELRDGAVRSVGIPLLGLALPHLTGSYGQLTWTDPWWWAGHGWFLLLSFTVWQGNRLLILRLRRTLDWETRPLRKLLLLIGGTQGYTLVLTAGAMAAWQAMAPFPGIDWPRVGLVAAVVGLAVLFVSHVYETTFLINGRLEDRLRLAQSERARLQAELDAVKGQLAPHFLFNCLHTLGVLIRECPERAGQFTRHLATVCRYLLERQKQDLVPLAEELAFFEAYAELCRLRFPEGLEIELKNFGNPAGRHIPPASLQLLLENALKHNGCSAAQPLRITLEFEDDALVFGNSCPATAAPAAPGAGVGLRNLRERFLLVVRRDISVRSLPGRFSVRLPLLLDEHTPASGVWN